MQRKLFKDYIAEITKEAIIKYYIDENHSANDTAKYFKVGISMFMRITKYYNIKKPKDLCTIQIKKTKKEKYGDENYNNQQKREETNINKYGVVNQFQRQEVIQESNQKKIAEYGNINNIQKNLETRIKNSGSLEASYKKQFDTYKQTCNDKYGVDNASKVEEVKAKISETMTKVYNNFSEEKKLEIANKISKANTGRTVWNTGLRYTLDKETIKREKEKEHITKTKNKSFNISTPEKLYKEYLISKYGSENIISPYRDPRYQFNCDFYVKPLDLFIELNLHWSHGKHPFESSNKEDQALLAIWQEKTKTSDFYKNAIKTWTERDIEKISIATKNKLNYKIIYKEEDVLKEIAEGK